MTEKEEKYSNLLVELIKEAKTEKVEIQAVLNYGVDGIVPSIHVFELIEEDSETPSKS